MLSRGSGERKRGRVILEMGEAKKNLREEKKKKDFLRENLEKWWI